MTIKAVIFDLGGVVFESPFHAIKQLHDEQGLPPKTAWRLWEKLERGEMTRQQFYEEWPVPAGGRSLLEAVEGALQVRLSFIRAIRALKSAGVIVGVITNNWSPEGDQSATLELEFRKLFDFYIESWRVGMRKPELGIYRIAMEKLRGIDESVTGNQIVFLDDMGVNLKAARGECGWHTIKVEPERQRWVNALLELQDVTGVRLFRARL